MESIKIQDQKITLVDQAVERLINFFLEQDYKLGDVLPNEMELAKSLGVARSVLREALSRFKMSGLIESRTRRGMVMAEPYLFGGMKMVVNPKWLSEESLIDILELRISLEIGMTESIFRNITQEQIEEIESIVKVGNALEGNRYAPISEYAFHTKLYEISGNRYLIEFQNIIHPVMDFVKEKFKDYFEPLAIKISENGSVVSHADLLSFLKKGDKDGYSKAIVQHFKLYSDYLDSIQK